MDAIKKQLGNNENEQENKIKLNINIINNQEQDPEQQQLGSQGNQDEDSNEEKVLVGKPIQEIKLRKLMKQKLKTTNIQNLEFDDIDGNSFKFSQFYDYHKFLGCGSFGFVVSAIDRESGEHLALKIVDGYNQSQVQCIKKEAYILQEIHGHQNIVQFRHIKEFENYIILAIENVKGGTIQDLIKMRYSQKKLPLTEEECSKIIKGILQGLKHIHNLDYVHRDLKPSNILLDNIEDFGSVKLVDFGLATKMENNEGIDGTCGTLVYQAPEQMMGENTYGKYVDIWATGFIMYELISGQHPLYTKGEDKQQYRDKLKCFKQLQYPNGKFSRLAQNLLDKLCIFKPLSRYKVEQALAHPWITRNLDAQIPRTIFEENIFIYEIDQKIRKVQKLFIALFYLVFIDSKFKHVLRISFKIQRSSLNKIRKRRMNQKRIRKKETGRRIKIKLINYFVFKRQSQQSLRNTLIYSCKRYRITKSKTSRAYH